MLLSSVWQVGTARLACHWWKKSGSLKHGHLAPRARWVSQCPVHSAIARQETAGCLDSHMGRRQVTKDFRCLCLLRVSVSDDFCESKLDSVDFGGILTVVRQFPFLLYSCCHAFRLRRRGCALFSSGFRSHRVASPLIVMITLSIQTASGQQSKWSSRYPHFV